MNKEQRFLTPRILFFAAVIFLTGMAGRGAAPVHSAELLPGMKTYGAIFRNPSTWGRILSDRLRDLVPSAKTGFAKGGKPVRFAGPVEMSRMPASYESQLNRSWLAYRAVSRSA